MKVLSNPTVMINNVIVTPKPNSVSVADGKGEKTVKGISSGAGFTDIVVSEDVETKVGKIKMSFNTTQENIELLRTWQSIDLNIGNIVSLTEDDYHGVLTGGVVTGDPDKSIGVDGSFDVEFHGRPVI